MLNEGKEFEHKFEGAKITILPSARGKKVMNGVH
jgi:predicted SpoU family rRNA methylase